MAVQLVKEFPAFIELGISLPYSQESATGPYPESDESVSHSVSFPEDRF